MSVRAYKIKKITTEKEASFNLWENHELIEELASDWENNSFNGGILELELSKVRNRLSGNLRELKALAGESDQEEAAVLEAENKILNQIIRDAKGKEFIEYYCY